jgi:hypothetical protein
LNLEKHFNHTYLVSNCRIRVSNCRTYAPTDGEKNKGFFTTPARILFYNRWKPNKLEKNGKKIACLRSWGARRAGR